MAGASDGLRLPEDDPAMPNMGRLYGPHGLTRMNMLITCRWCSEPRQTLRRRTRHGKHGTHAFLECAVCDRPDTTGEHPFREERLT